MESIYSSELTEEAIIKKILRGEKELFEILVRKVNPVLYRIARTYGFHHEEAEDLMQDTHLAAFLKLDSFQQRSTYKTWISKIMIRHCLYRLKYGYRKYETMKLNNDTDFHPTGLKGEPSYSTENAMETKEFKQIIEQSLERLPLSYRTVFVLRDLEGYSIAETASLLEISLVNVKVRLSRARAMLQKEIEKAFSRTEIYGFHLERCNLITEKVMDAVKNLPH